MDNASPKPLVVTPAVLLLEDNEAYRTLLTEVLTRAGFEVCAAPDGRRVADRRTAELRDDHAAPVRPVAASSSAFSMDPPAAPRIVLCPIATNFK